MITSEFDDIRSRFLVRVTDYKLVSMDENTTYDMMNEWMKSVISKPYIRRLFSYMDFNEDKEIMEYELKNPIDNDEDKMFIDELMTDGMVVEWLEPQVNSVINTHQVFSNSEQKFYSQAQHMSELKDMLSIARGKVRRLIRDRGYIHNSYLG